MKIILFFPGPFHVAWYPLWEFSKTGRKDREREGTQDDGITHVTCQYINTRPQDPTSPRSDPSDPRSDPGRI